MEGRDDWKGMMDTWMEVMEVKYDGKQELNVRKEGMNGRDGLKVLKELRYESMEGGDVNVRQRRIEGSDEKKGWKKGKRRVHA